MNQPAFPIQAHGPITLPNGAVATNTGHNGMTLRDYFAAKALNVLITTTTEWTKVGADITFKHRPDEQAKWAYEYADAMLKAREQSNG